MAKRPDPLAKKVYAWEDSWPEWNEEHLTLQQCRELVHLACAAYDLEPPAVRQHDGDMAYSITATPPDGSFISFVPQHKNKAIALHEAAHYITDKLYGERPNHGAKWQGVYMFLLSKADIATVSALKASAEKAGLKWYLIPPKKKGRR